MITARGTPRKLNLVLDNIDDKKIDFTNSFKLPCRCNMHQTNNSYLIKGEKRRQLMAELAAPSFNLHEIDVSYSLRHGRCIDIVFTAYCCGIFVSASARFY